MAETKRTTRRAGRQTTPRRRCALFQPANRVVRECADCRAAVAPRNQPVSRQAGRMGKGRARTRHPPFVRVALARAVENRVVGKGNRNRRFVVAGAKGMVSVQSAVPIRLAGSGTVSGGVRRFAPRGKSRHAQAGRASFARGALDELELQAGRRRIYRLRAKR